MFLSVAPTVIADKPTLSVLEGDSLTIRCLVRSSPLVTRLTFHFQHGTRRLNATNIVSPQGVTLEATVELVIASADHSADSGVYTCVASVPLSDGIYTSSAVSNISVMGKLFAACCCTANC